VISHSLGKHPSCVMANFVSNLGIAPPRLTYRVFARTYLGILDQKWSKTMDSGDWNIVRYRRSGPETRIPTRRYLSIHATGRDNYGGQTVLYPSQCIITDAPKIGTVSKRDNRTRRIFSRSMLLIYYFVHTRWQFQ
jgi:hypothetical protein